MRRYCFTIELKNDDKLIAEYEQHHANIPAGVVQSFRDAGIQHLELYRLGTRLFMIFDVNDSFSFEKKDAIDRESPDVQKWETQMARYQQAAPGALAGEKWKMMDRIYSFSN